MQSTARLYDDSTVVQRILDHIDHRTTDLCEGTWREPVENYRSAERLAAELAVLRAHPSVLCPSAALPEIGSYVAREAAGTPLLAVRGNDGRVRAFRNACRHRGTEIAAGAGCTKAFVCRYHGWTYGLDGSLRHVPHEHGFPGLDKSTRGLVPVETAEVGGVVFVTQEPRRGAEDALESIPSLIPPDYRLLVGGEDAIDVNWKIFVEGFLEGYHIRTTHPQTFYPLQYDNLNVVESFGPNSRIAYPYRAIEKLRDAPPTERSADGKLTYVYHLFPNGIVATFPGRIVMACLEPIAPGRTRLVNYLLTNQDQKDSQAQSSLQRGGDLVALGATEDRDVALAIQRSIASGANEFFEFGRFEGAIVHFHRTLGAALEKAA